MIRGGGGFGAFLFSERRSGFSNRDQKVCFFSVYRVAF
jgi:hypothetical protein